MANASPESAKIAYLNLELNSAKTRIVQLDTKVKDQECTIKIQKEKIKLLELSQHTTANNAFIPPETTQRQSCASFCSQQCYHPQLQSSCHHNHRCQSYQEQHFQCYQGEKTVKDAEYLATLNAIKSSFEGVTECVLNIANVIVKEKHLEKHDKPEISDEEHINDMNEIPNQDDPNNDSITSADENVPDISNEQPLNSQAPTCQLMKLM